jgi:threonine synthase
MAGIWNNLNLEKYNKLPEIQVSLGEGKTPLNNIKINKQRIWIKDENTNPTGSFKDRCLAYQISYYYSLGEKDFVISSSGNAAISAASIIKLLPDASIDIFIAHNINPKKLEKLLNLKDQRIRLKQDFKAKSAAVLYAKQEGKINLRASKDDVALIGYKTIAYELELEAKQSDGIFIPASSGTAALGIALGFKDMGINIPIYICQTTKINSLAKDFDNDFRTTKTSLADAIVDRIGYRKEELSDFILSSGGDAFAVSDELLYIAREEMLEAGFDYSFNSLLGLAGLIKAREQNKKISLPIILASGL